MGNKKSLAFNEVHAVHAAPQVKHVYKSLIKPMIERMGTVSLGAQAVIVTGQRLDFSGGQFAGPVADADFHDYLPAFFWLLVACTLRAAVSMA